MNEWVQFILFVASNLLAFNLGYVVKELQVARKDLADAKAEAAKLHGR